MKRLLLLAPLALPALLGAQAPVRIEGLAYGSWFDARGIARELLLDLYLPAAAAAPLPVVVWIHGGGWETGDRAQVPWYTTAMTGRGYAVASIDYRLSGQAAWPAQIHDGKAAIRFLRAQASSWGLDPDRIGVFGDSAGGHLAAALGTMGGVGPFAVGSHAVDLEGAIGNHLDVSSRVQAVCDWYGPTTMLHAHDFPGCDHDAPDSFVSRLLGGPLQRRPAEWAAADPITFLGADDAPMLIQHGTNDTIVPFHQSELLYAAAVTAGLDVTWAPIANNAHGGPGFTDASNLQRVYAFFDRTLRDLPATTVSILATDATAAEDRQDQAVFTLTRTGPVLAPLTVRLCPGGGADYGVDYAPLPLLAVIPAGSATRTIALHPVDDALVEGDEPATLTLGASPDYRIDSARSAATALLLDNDDATGLPRVDVSAVDAFVAEAGAAGRFAFVRTGPLSSPLTVAYDVVGTATRGSDFAGAGGTLTFAVGAAQAIATVTAIDDGTPEASETVIVKLRAGTGYALGQARSAHLVITDDDRAALPIVNVIGTDPDAGEPADAAGFTITRTGATTLPLVVHVQLGGSARAGVDYLPPPATVTIPAGWPGTVLHLPVLDDLDAEGPEDIVLTVLPDPAYALSVQPSSRLWLEDDDTLATPADPAVRLLVTPLPPAATAFAAIAGGSPGAVAFLAVSTGRGCRALPPLGAVLLDLGSASLIGVARLDADGTAVLPIPDFGQPPTPDTWLVFQALAPVPGPVPVALSAAVTRRVDPPPVH